MCENIQLMFAVLRIGIYSLFRRICCMGPPPVKPNFSVICLGLGGSGKSTLLAKVSGETIDEIAPTVEGYVVWALLPRSPKGPSPVKPNFSVICLGLGGSGKSTLLAKVSGETIDEIAPTVGFSIKALMFSDCFVDVKELGGGENVRPYWNRYYQGSQGVIFVIDCSCDEKTMETAIKEFNKAMDDEQLDGLPLFVIANFQDVPGARSTDDIRDLFKLDDQQRQWVIHGCTASDKNSIQTGFEKYNKFLLSPHSSGATGEFTKI